MAICDSVAGTVKRRSIRTKLASPDISPNAPKIMARSIARGLERRKKHPTLSGFIHGNRDAKLGAAISLAFT
jgi:hypothetical protein